MMGVRAWERVPCSCCNGPRPRSHQRRVEEREWRKELELEDIELCEWCQNYEAVGLFDLDDVETGLCATCATDNNAEAASE